MTLSSLALRGPEHAVALLPHLLGFWPQESLIAIWIEDDHVALTQRVDLPVGLDAEGCARFATWFVDLAHHAQPTGALIVVVSTEPSRCHALALAVGDEVDDRGLDLLDVLWNDTDAYGSLLCDGDCCPSTGHTVRPELREDIAAAFAVNDEGPLASRADLAACVERIDRAVEDLMPGLAAREQEIAVLDSTGFASWRREQVPLVGRALDAGHGVTTSDMVTISAGLADVQVRDVVMWHLARGSDIRDAVDALTHTLRAAPDGYVAPVATCLAMASWFCGNGALAVMALERALCDDPDYSLAQLAATAIGSGIPPSGWRQVLASMSEEQLRIADSAA